jgi:hypothetical protein
MTIILDGTAGITTPAETTTGNESVGGNLSVTGTVSVGGSTMYPLVSGTAVASTSGTSLDFLAIPAWVKRITVMLSGVSTSGTSDVIIQIGAGSIEATSYAGLTNRQTGGGNTISSFTTGFNIDSGLGDATAVRRGFFTLDLVGSNIWILVGTMSNIGAANSLCTTSGNKTTSGTLDRVRITTVNGTDTFDAGTVNLLWE